MTTGFVSPHHRPRNAIAAIRKMRVVRHSDCSERQTVCSEAARPTLPNLARGVANRANSASLGNSTQTTFSFVFRLFLCFCRCFPQVALRFRDGGAVLALAAGHQFESPLRISPVAADITLVETCALSQGCNMFVGVGKRKPECNL